MTNRAIRVPSIEVIFHEHDSGTDLENQGLGCETSLLEGFDELVPSLGLHLEYEYITRNRVESVLVIGIDSYIASKELCMILCIYSYIA